MSSSLLLQQCPTCFVRLISMVLEMGRRWPCSGCFVECCFLDLFKIACNILVQSRLGFSLYTLSAFMWCIQIVEWIHDRSLRKIVFYFIGYVGLPYDR